MMQKKLAGFIGGGRITRIILEGFKRKNLTFEEITVSDTNLEVLNKFKGRFPEIKISANDNKVPASKDIVFLALHPPVIPAVLDEIKVFVKPNSVLVSLAPKLTIDKIIEHVGGFQRIVRMIPNACSVINAGYNPISFAQVFTEAEKKDLLKILEVLGECPEVDEEKLEAYTILTAMGPTYFWFQLRELEKIAGSFGLTLHEVKEGIFRMTIGAANTLYNSGLSPEEIMDLIPVKPLGEAEENIKNVYRSKLGTLYEKLKGQTRAISITKKEIQHD